MTTGTIRLHRVLRAKPERIYRAFLDAAAMAKWLPPYGFTCQVHQLEAKVGGTHRMSFTNFTTGQAHSFGGVYRELVPSERNRYTDSFDDPKLPGEMLGVAAYVAIAGRLIHEHNAPHRLLLKAAHTPISWAFLEVAWPGQY